jgi:hypothetical protein
VIRQQLTKKLPYKKVQESSEACRYRYKLRNFEAANGIAGLSYFSAIFEKPIT